MEYYICRLMKCGYTRKKAENLCDDFLKKHSIIEFVVYIEDLEDRCEKCG